MHTHTDDLHTSCIQVAQINRSNKNQKAQSTTTEKTTQQSPSHHGHESRRGRLGLALDAAPDLAPRLLARLAGRLDALHRRGLEVLQLLGPLLHLLIEPAHLLDSFLALRSARALVGERWVR